MKQSPVLMNMHDPFARLRRRVLVVLAQPLNTAVEHCPRCGVVMQSGMCPVCGWTVACTCGRIRQADKEWRWIGKKLDIQLQISHGICPSCKREHYPEFCEVENAKKGVQNV
jgi:hypothetical protein